MKKREYKEQERQRHYYFFDYLFWLGEITWKNYQLESITGKKKAVENVQVENQQGWSDYLSLHFIVGARQEVPNKVLQHLINQDGRTSCYGQPVYIMQVREKDMGGEFRVEKPAPKGNAPITTYKTAFKHTLKK